MQKEFQKESRSNEASKELPSREKINEIISDTTLPPVLSKDNKSEKNPEKEVIQEEKYFKVKFHAKSKPDDEDNVILSVNGEVLVVGREKDVVLPERFVVCAENARYQQFRQLPNQPRKVVGEVLVYPFEKKGMGTKAEYLDMKKSGTKTTREKSEQANFSS